MVFVIFDFDFMKNKRLRLNRMRASYFLELRGRNKVLSKFQSDKT